MNSKKYSKNFTQISNSVIFDKDVTDAEFRLIVALKSYQYYDGEIFPSQATLADRLGKSREWANGCLSRLKRKGKIDYKRKSFASSNRYSLICENIATNGVSACKDKFTSSMKKMSHKQLSNNYMNNTKYKNTKVNNKLEYIKVRESINKIRKEHAWLKQGKEL